MILKNDIMVLNYGTFRLNIEESIWMKHIGYAYMLSYCKSLIFSIKTLMVGSIHCSKEDVENLIKFGIFLTSKILI